MGGSLNHGRVRLKHTDPAAIPVRAGWDTAGHDPEGLLSIPQLPCDDHMLLLSHWLHDADRARSAGRSRNAIRCASRELERPPGRPKVDDPTSPRRNGTSGVDVVASAVLGPGRTGEA